MSVSPNLTTSAQKSNDEPFDVEIFSKSRNMPIAGVQLVEAYDDSRRGRDEKRHKAVEELCAVGGMAKFLDGWFVVIKTATALLPSDESNKVGNQLGIIRELLIRRVDWSQDQFSVSGANVTVSGVRRHSRKTGSLWYMWRGGLPPVADSSLFLRAAKSKLAKDYARRTAPPFWLLAYSLSQSPDASDRRVCSELLKGQNTFDDIFLLDVIGGRVFRLSEHKDVESSPEETSSNFEFQLDPSSVTDAGSFDEENFIEIKLSRS
ncbi:MAG: hypothetical protein SF187_18700 [Deltaproteobacteria bacterium]|nr:hypothetical protein [Deltaproteobacteria bacterium]